MQRYTKYGKSYLCAGIDLPIQNVTTLRIVHMHGGSTLRTFFTTMHNQIEADRQKDRKALLTALGILFLSFSTVQRSAILSHKFRLSVLAAKLIVDGLTGTHR
jgi:hypothetical protein